jgi:hypothetical protein
VRQHNEGSGLSPANEDVPKKMFTENKAITSRTSS